jgi:lipoyl(octanoyl) transferase
MKDSSELIIRHLGQQDYQTTWQRMREFTDSRTENTNDELWLLEHPPVFTMGQAGKSEHLLCPGDIPVINTDRGGQVTYHGPGQLVIYFLIDLRRKTWGVKCLVSLIEQSVIDTVKQYHVDAHLQEGAPGVYVQGEKIASIGLRVRHGCTYHGLSFNIKMDLEPFLRINPCGYQGLKVTQLSHFSPSIRMEEITTNLIRILSESLNKDSFSQCAQTTNNEIAS